MNHVQEDMDAWGLTHPERVRYLNRVWQYRHARNEERMVRVTRSLNRKWDVRLLWGCAIAGSLLWTVMVLVMLLE